MYGLQGLIRRNIVNTQTQFERLGYISTNFANYNTTGYKSVRFEQMLDENGYLDGAVRTNCANGSMRRTENKLDVAIQGIGYIPVTSADGDVTYTREGAFKVDVDGFLVTNDGYLVGEGIKLPANHEHLKINAKGEVLVYDLANPEETVIGKIPLVTFMNPEGLKSVGYNKFVATEDSGEPILMKEHDNFRQGYLETSNTNVFAGVSDMLRLNASMIASMTLMKVVDGMYEKSVNLRS